MGILLILAFLFLGVYGDREFDEKHLFIKYRPCLKFYFYSPQGEMSPGEANLTEDELEQEKLFVEFVEDHWATKKNQPAQEGVDSWSKK